MRTAISMINTKMANDSKYKEDQTAFRSWIGRAEDALSELVDKLEESGMNLVTTSSQAPPATSDLATILQQMAKQQADTQKQLGKQFSESQALMSQKFADSQKESADKFTEAIKISGKSKLKRVQPTFSPKQDIDDYSLYRKFKKDFEHFISDVDPAN